MVLGVAFMSFAVGYGLELVANGKGESAIKIGFIELIKKFVDRVVKVERNALTLSNGEQHTCAHISSGASEVAMFV